MTIMPQGYWKDYYWKNREKLLKNNPERYQKSKVVIKEIAKKWALANPERRKAIIKKCKDRINSDPIRKSEYKEKAKRKRKDKA